MPRDGDPDRRRVLRCRPRRAARRDGRSVVPDRSGPRERLLSLDRGHPRGRPEVALDADPPRLRLPRRTGALRHGRRGGRVHVRGSATRGDRALGGQGRGETDRRRGGRPHHPRDAGAGRRHHGEERGASDRVPTARQGGVRGRRQGHARRAGRRSTRGVTQARGPRGEVVLRPVRGLPRALRRSRATRRGADHRRCEGQRRVPGRARLFRPATPSEAGRGDTVAAVRRRTSRAVRRGRDLAHEGGRLRQRRDGRMRPRRRRLLLLPGDEHADPGRAPRHRDGDGARRGRTADPGRAGWLARGSRGRRERPRDRMPDQCRGSGAELPPGTGTDRSIRGAQRTVRSRGQRGRRPARHPGGLRLLVREAHRERDRSRAGSPTHASRPRRVRRRGGADHDPASSMDLGVEGVQDVDAYDHVARTGSGRRPSAGASRPGACRRTAALDAGARHPRGGRRAARAASSTSAASLRPKPRRRTRRIAGSTCTARSAPRCRGRS